MVNFQFAADKIDPASPAQLDAANFERFLFDRSCGADSHTAAAEVAKPFKGQHILFDADDRAIPTKVAALTTRRACLKIDLRYIHGDLLSGGYLGPQKNVTVRLFNIAIEILELWRRFADYSGEIGGNRGLSRPTLTAGNSNNEAIRHLTYPYQNEIGRSALPKRLVRRF